MTAKKQKQIPLSEFREKYFQPLQSLYNMVLENIDGQVEALKILRWNVSTPMKIAFIGEFNHGKSSVVNLLLDRENLLPTSNKKETTIITNIFPLFCSDFSEFSITNEHGVLIDREKNTHEILNLNDLLAVMADPSKSSRSFELDIYVDNDFLRKNVIIIDTPGFYVEFGKKEFPIEIAKISDLIVIVSDLNKPLTKFHDKFLKEISIHAEKAILVINKADLSSGTSDIREAMTHISSYKQDLNLTGHNFLISAKGSEKAETESEWDNEELKKYIFEMVTEKRFDNKSRNWVLNILEMLSVQYNKDNKTIEKVLKEIKKSMDSLEKEKALWEELTRKTKEKYLSQKFQLDQRLQIIQNNIEKIVHKHSNEANIAINKTIGEWKERKNSSLIQRKIKNLLIDGITKSNDEFSAAIKRDVDDFNKYWFKRFSKLPDSRVLNVSMSLKDAIEVRSIIYNFIFEKQSRWIYKEWDDFIELLKEKGYTQITENTNILAMFVKRIRELLFDFSSEDYLLNKITNSCRVDELSEEDKKLISHVEIKEVQDAGLFSRIFLGTTFDKLKDQIREKAEDQRESKFKELQSKFFSILKKFSEDARKSIQETEVELKKEFISTMDNIKRESIKNTANSLVSRLEEVLQDVPLPFED